MTKEKAEAFVKELNELCKRHDVNLYSNDFLYIDDTCVKQLYVADCTDSGASLYNQ